ncbi:DUF1648 domain-containing protein [Niabella sp.]|uniref:DUF1648 domain-containing protein n=1 Tax=Niabella sp. TaxID=1962976 RepID=UPI002635E5B6|nr:DUF1648 domain-containing protein [Niabella sp.]
MIPSTQEATPSPAKPHRLLVRLAWLLQVVSLGIALGTLPQLPEQIPIHFNIRGTADNFGSKYTLLLLPAIFTLVLLLLHFVKKNPSRFNYPVTITSENRERQYRLAQRMCTWLQLATGILSVLLVFFIRYSTLHGTNPAGRWLVVVIMLIYIAPTIVYLFRAFKK